MKKLEVFMKNEKIILKENGLGVEELTLTPQTKITRQNRKGELVSISRDDFSHGFAVGTTSPTGLYYKRLGNNLTIELKGRKVLEITEED